MSGKFEEALEKKLRCLDYLRTAAGQQGLLGVVVDMGMDSRRTRETFGTVVYESLKNGVPYYWTEEVLETLEAVYTTLDNVQIEISDLPCPVGFLYFPRPVRMGVSITGNPRLVDAISWIGVVSEDTATGVSTENYAPERVTEISFICYSRQFTGTLLPGAWINFDLTKPYEIHKEETSSYLPSDMPQEERENLIEFSDNQLKFIMSAFLFLSQPAFKIEEEALPRPARRRVEARKTENRQDSVRVVYLRRPQRRPSGEHREVHWTHRWWIRLHWRTYRNEDGSVKKRRLIFPYVKGPEGLELKAPDPKIFAVVR